ncbi:hypothetical protein SAMN04488570_0446 [Nocardioides scoriae]|uniref:Uncharacterized protein n=1 Tax=Nocardioides scoriae TaxID=642780 RepID=A0A1H1M4K1_9ACTN|nr:hypothetical protein [Nocardioides scoriae]SDR80929.1 hypothetical protein SAMN04488570_0446 [Nocardioides scoriae]
MTPTDDPREDPTDVAALVERLPLGWSEATYAGRRWGVARSRTAGGRAGSVYAEELGGTDVVSTNVYRVGGTWVLKPCEMPEAKVRAFLEGQQPLTPETDEAGALDGRYCPRKSDVPGSAGSFPG